MQVHGENNNTNTYNQLQQHDGVDTQQVTALRASASFCDLLSEKIAA